MGPIKVLEVIRWGMAKNVGNHWFATYCV